MCQFWHSLCLAPLVFTANKPGISIGLDHYLLPECSGKDEEEDTECIEWVCPERFNIETHNCTISLALPCALHLLHPKQFFCLGRFMSSLLPLWAYSLRCGHVEQKKVGFSLCESWSIGGGKNVRRRKDGDVMSETTYINKHLHMNTFLERWRIVFFFPRCQQHPKAGKNRLEEEEEKHEATKAEKLLGMQ